MIEERKAARFRTLAPYSLAGLAWRPYWIATQQQPCSACIPAPFNAWCFEVRSQVSRWASSGASGPPQSTGGSTAETSWLNPRKNSVFRR